MRVFITGITGMVGSHLAEYIIKEKLGEVYGLVRWRSPLDNINHFKEKVNLINGDLNDLNSLIAVIRQVKPHRIFHLAAQSYVQDSFKITSETLKTNIIGTTNLLDSVKINKLDPLIHICSSSEVYGQVLESEVPIKENNPLRPASPYAVSKVGEDFVALQYFLSYGMKTIRTRMFTHTGPRRGNVFAESSFAKQIAEIEANIHPTGFVSVGNLESVRTFSDVRDAVRAYWILLDKCEPGEVYNIGGKETMTVGKMLEILKSFSKIDINHKIDAKHLRPSDVTLQIPDCSKFLKKTNWKPHFTVEETLHDLLNYHRQNIVR